jgi:hypothetical protein
MAYTGSQLNSDLGNIAEDTYTYINNILINPTVIIILLVVFIAYIVIFIYLGDSESNSSLIDNLSSSSSSKSYGSNIIMILVVFIFIILIFVNGFQYIFGMDFMAKIKGLFSNQPEVEINVNQNIPTTSVPEIRLKPQVFNIPGNTFSYNDANALCKAYGARLSTYSEVEDAYQKGGEWCNYGWSEGQMALFPTQKKTWDKLQTIQGHEHDCGRPGINGGYIANPKVKFGVNCYGYKPQMNRKEQDIMANQPIYPLTMKDIAMENRIKYWKDKLPEIIVSPFNHNNWSKL